MALAVCCEDSNTTLMLFSSFGMLKQRLVPKGSRINSGNSSWKCELKKMYFSCTVFSTGQAGTELTSTETVIKLFRDWS